MKPFAADRYGQIPTDNGYFYATAKKDIFPLKQIEFGGKHYPAPNNIHKHLTNLYGTYSLDIPDEKKISHAELYLPDTPYSEYRKRLFNE